MYYHMYCPSPTFKILESHADEGSIDGEWGGQVYYAGLKEWD
jgi:hypothetical protein